jgi:hypothetical protein
MLGQNANHLFDLIYIDTFEARWKNLSLVNCVHPDE